MIARSNDIGSESRSRNAASNPTSAAPWLKPKIPSKLLLRDEFDDPVVGAFPNHETIGQLPKSPDDNDGASTKTSSTSQRKRLLRRAQSAGGGLRRCRGIREGTGFCGSSFALLQGCQSRQSTIAVAAAGQTRNARWCERRSQSRGMRAGAAPCRPTCPRRGRHGDVVVVQARVRRRRSADVLVASGVTQQLKGAAWKPARPLRRRPEERSSRQDIGDHPALEAAPRSVPGRTSTRRNPVLTGNPPRTAGEMSSPPHDRAPSIQQASGSGRSACDRPSDCQRRALVAMF